MKDNNRQPLRCHYDSETQLKLGFNMAVLFIIIPQHEEINCEAVRAEHWREIIKEIK